MKKFNSNDKGSVESTLIMLLFSLTFSSMIISFILLQVFGAAVAYQNPAIALPLSGIVSGNQNFITNTIVDNVNYVNGLGDYVYVPSVGRVLMSNPSGVECWLLLSHVSPTNNVYSVSYDINNSVKQNYGVFARTVNNDNIYNEKIEVKDDGFHVFGLWETGFYPYPNANQVAKVKIRTEFNEEEGTLAFYFNGVLVFTKTGISKSIISTSDAHYAGVFSKTVGFTVEGINAGLFNFNSSNVLEQIATFLGVLSQIVLWNVQEQYFPLILNFIFIKTQLAGIVVCIAVIIRG